MAIASVNCALKPPPPTSSTSSQAPKAVQIPCNVSFSSWRSRCFSSLASVLITSSMAEFSGGSEIFFPADNYQVSVETVGQVLRWSERRMCPQWDANSLENIVPENLPRPSPRRKFNSVGSYTMAPAVGISSGSSCFTL